MENRRIHVLVVEDHELDCKILRKIISGQYDYAETHDGKEAIEYLESHPDEVDVILLDLVMPVMDGRAFLSYRQNSKWEKIPVIVMTDDRLAEKEVLNLGATDFLSKPYEPDILYARMHNVISRSRMHLLENLQYLTDHDPLTGLYNAKRMHLEVKKMLERYTDIQFTSIRVDIDKFRLMNTFWGEDRGDDFLRFVAQSLREEATKYKISLYGRIHADIFWIVLPYEKEKLQESAVSLQEKVQSFNKDYAIEMTFGVYIIEDRSESTELMFSKAAMAAREVKKEFGSYIGHYNNEMGQRLRHEQQILNEMQPALDQGEFVPWFQPKYNLESGRPFGAEALVRWEHPKYGQILPGDFIPIFEKNGFIGKIDTYMWEQACIHLRKWIDEGLNPAPLSVNVSRISMCNPHIVTQLKELVDRYGITPDLLNLELTESAYMDNPEIMRKAVTALQKEGFTIMMDDFGSGYSSLNSLKDIPVDILKIDINFLANSESDGRNERILASVIRMAGWLELPVVVEGVETKAQKEFLESVGCGYVQGYYFARPMPLEDYEKILREGNQVPAKMDAENRQEIINAIWSSHSDVELVFKSIQQPVAVYEYENGRFSAMRVNEPFNDWFGYGENFLNNKGEYNHHVSSEHFRDIIGAFQKAIKDRGLAECEFLFTDDRGHNRWIRLNLKYLGRNEKSNIVFATFNDESARKKVEGIISATSNLLQDTEVIKKRLLIVDDTELSREMIKNMFQKQYEVLEAGNGQEALDLLEKEAGTINAIILDIMMPVMDGKEFLKIRNQNPVLNAIPVVVISADADENSELKLLELGVNDYISKPFVPEVMKKRVENVMEYNSRFHKLMKEYREMLKSN